MSRTLSPIYPFHQWFDLLDPYLHVIICSALRSGFSTFQSANEDRQEVNFRGKNEVRGVIFSSNKAISSRDFRFGAKLKKKKIKNLCLQLKSPCVSPQLVFVGSLLQHCFKMVDSLFLPLAYLEWLTNKANYTGRPAMWSAGTQMRW